MVLAQDGKQPTVVEEIISSVKASGEPSAPELLSLTYILASLVFEKEADRIWLQRRFHMLRDVLRDTWAYQEIMQEGLQEGLQEGRQEGRQEGLQEGLQAERKQRLNDQRQILMTIMQARFAQLAPRAKKHAESVTEPEVLQKVVLQVLAAQSEEQVKQALLLISPKKKKK